ncbi:MAG TPA: HDOD domain-containing protein [Tepidisphaeraceae bacterium]|jgi:HD-like signal output (HDOD) protein|nr:HDOD domain-containing protein [Tepidisphaeraceae bacterium]
MTTAACVEPQVLAREAIRRVSTLATLPEVTAKIVQTVEDPKSTAAALHKIVAHDPALVSRILKVVNSAFYGLPGQIGSIERAIVLLGLNAVKNIAVAASLGQLFRGVKLCEGFTAKDLWTHSIAVGITARALAQELQVQIADEAFLAGMIHDIGMLVALQVWPEQLMRVCEAAQQAGGGVDFCQLERDISGADHQHLGMALTEAWKFPRSCQLVAGYHHRPAELAADTRLLVTIVHVADTLCAQHNHGFNLTAAGQKLDEVDLFDVKIDLKLVKKVEENLDKLVSGASGMFL